MQPYCQLKETNVLFNVVFIIWLVSLSVIIALLYRDMIRLRYTKEAKEIVNRPKMGFVVPGSGFFTIKEKRSAIVNDDVKSWHNEVNSMKSTDD